MLRLDMSRSLKGLGRPPLACLYIFRDMSAGKKATCGRMASFFDIIFGSS